MNDAFAPGANVGHNAVPSASDYTPTALKRWSSNNANLPEVNRIRHIHIYDFDNTLFASPLPNQLIWTPLAIKTLQKPQPFINGGWWHDDTILASTGEGLEKEEPRAWQGWWNEDVVESARRSIGQANALTVLLTGRAERNFTELLLRISKSRHLNFDMVCLKPQVTPTNHRVKSTMDFKTKLIQNIMLTYTRADKIKIWEDRVHHVRQFRRVIEEFNKAVRSGIYEVRRPKIWYDIVEVKSLATSLNQVKEVSEVQRIINQHNQAVYDRKAPHGSQPWKMVEDPLYTAYYIASNDDRRRLARLAQIPRDDRQEDIVYHSTHAVVHPGALSDEQLRFLGGINNSVRFRVTHLGVHDDGLWAVKIQPVVAAQKVSLDDDPLTVVLACYSDVRPSQEGEIRSWQPVTGETLEFDAQLRERVALDLQQEGVFTGTDQQSRPGQDARQAWTHLPRKPVLNGNHKRPRHSSSSADDGVNGTTEPAEYIALDFEEPPPATRYIANGRPHRDHRPAPAIAGASGPHGTSRERGRGNRRGDLRGGRGGPSGIRDRDRERDDHFRPRGVAGGARGGGGGGRGGRGSGAYAREAYYDDFDGRDGRERRYNQQPPPYRDNHPRDNGYYRDREPERRRHEHGHGHGAAHGARKYQDLDAAYHMDGAGEARDEGLYDAY